MTTTTHTIEAKTFLFWVVSSASRGHLEEAKVSTSFALQSCLGLESMLGPHRALLKQVTRLSDLIIEGGRKPKVKNPPNNVRNLHAKENP